METASITIKLKGAKALQALNGKGVVTVAKLKGAGLALTPVANAAAVPAAEIEAKGVLAGNMVGTAEVEGTRVAVATGNAPAGAKTVSGSLSTAKSAVVKPAAAASQAVAGQAPAAKGLVAKPAAAASKVVAAKAPAAQAMQSTASSAVAKVPVLKAVGAGKSVAVAGKAATGTIWSGTGLSLGLGLGLGAVGPAVLLGALGLTATGIYLYRRNRQVELEPEASGNFDLDGVFVSTPTNDQ